MEEREVNTELDRAWALISSRYAPHPRGFMSVGQLAKSSIRTMPYGLIGHRMPIGPSGQFERRWVLWVGTTFRPRSSTGCSTAHLWAFR